MQFPAVRAGFGLRLGGQRWCGGFRAAGPGTGRAAVRLPAGHRSLHRGVNREVPTEHGDGQDPGHLGPQRRQAKRAAEQDRAALRARQGRQAAGVRVANPGHVDDEAAGTRTEHAQQPFAHSRRRRDVKVAPEGDDGAAGGGCHGKNQGADVIDHRMGHSAFRSGRWLLLGPRTIAS